MAVVPIRIVGDPVLRTATEPVHVADDGSLPADLADLIKDLFDTMDAANGVGLAANQIGVSKAGVRLRLCRRARADDPPPRCRRQPGTRDVRGARDDAGSGRRRRGLPVRSRRIVPDGPGNWARVTGLDADGTPITIEGTDLFARMLQHETGHLDGFLYLDRLVGRHARSAKRAVKSHGWGVPGLTWTPGKDPDPFGH